MNKLEEALELLQSTVGNDAIRCAIVGSDSPDESSLFGTRDSLLNFAVKLIRLVSTVDKFVIQNHFATDSDCEHMPEIGAVWNDLVQGALYQLPGPHPYIVGCYVFNNPAMLQNALEKAVQADLPAGVKLVNDPQFKDLLEPNS